MMWTPENIAALCTGIAGVIGSVVVLIRQIQHANSTAAHGQSGGSGTSTPAA
jgi:hypothetical protein